MAVTSTRPAGTLVWPNALSPHATTVPSFLNARLWMWPDAMAVMFDTPAGNAGADPQVAIVPSVRNASEYCRPAEMATTLLRFGFEGGDGAGFPHVTTPPFLRIARL